VKIEIFADVASVAGAAAAFVAAESRTAIASRGSFVAALSGGTTPWLMLRAFMREEVRWDAVQFVQMDERVVPAGDPDRNLTHLNEILLAETNLRAKQIHAMPVEWRDLEAGAVNYAQTIAALAGSPSVLDLAHLGLGADGHTASLVPGDSVLDVTEADVAVTGIYQSRQRMTLTYPILNRARRVLWLVTGTEKAKTLKRLQSGDLSIPAGRIRRDRAVVFADHAAAAELTA
jgi:6-phosphogluconolactonase